MADRKGTSDLSGYKYSAMSNLVLQADRRLTPRNANGVDPRVSAEADYDTDSDLEATGDPESLAGRLTVKDMGIRTARDNPSQKKKSTGNFGVERGSLTEGGDVLEREQRKRKRDVAAAFGATDPSDQNLDIEDLRYRPRTQATRATFALITTIVSKHLGDVAAQYVRSAADAVLEYLKDSIMDSDKKQLVDELLGVTMSPKEFNELISLSKKITDYDAQDDEEEEKVEDVPEADGKEKPENEGVAVVFDDEDEDDGHQNFEVSDSSEGEEDDDQPLDEIGAGERAGAGEILAEGEELVVQGDSDATGDSSAADRIIPAHEIDAYWLQRQIGQVYEDAHTQQEKSHQALDILSATTEDGDAKPLRDVENDLMELFDYEHHELVATLVRNRDRIVWVGRFRRAAQHELADVEAEMIAAGHQDILQELRARETGVKMDAPGLKKMNFDLRNISLREASQKDVEMADAPEGVVGGLQPSSRLVNLDNIVFDQGRHLMTNPKVTLPPGSTRNKFKGYEEFHVPPPKAKRDPNEPQNMPTTELPAWAQPSFGNSKSLNRIQTKCFPTAFNDDGNMLVCAPTGSGKTNVAMLAMLREIGKHRDPRTGEIALDKFKIILIAPLKALVAEQVGNFGKRLEHFGIRVAELTGDRQLTKQQIAETQVIVTTPEKYDVITRKATDASYINLVRLICIDEIHLLHDERGPALESIVARTMRRSDQTGDEVRIVGLSATLPNYRDVASFLRVDKDNGLFHFDATYRPCPLQQQYIGISEKKAIKQLKTMNDVCYTKVIEQVGKQRNQMLIFVHSRKETAKTGKFIRDKALELDTIGQILRSDHGTQEILRQEAGSVTHPDLKDLLPYGFGIHHAGMTRADRQLVEDLFSDGAIQVLVCTATLAWGVNLPAHTVVIKGTQVYSPERGSWVELSPQDVLQMLGRAGRPQFDTFGEGIIITTSAEVQYYLSLLNQQLPIESQFISQLADHLNAEIVLGNVRTRDEGVDWLGYTYLFVRMLRQPVLYRIGPEYEHDTVLEQRRVDLIHAAAHVLEKSRLIKYDKKTGALQPTELGRIASHYYLGHNSVATYSEHLQDGISLIELFRIFALSAEFKYIPVRQDEKLELAKLIQRVPIPVKEGVEEPQAKINVLLQTYISRLKLDGLALQTDMVYVYNNAGRIMRAMFEISLKNGWAQVAKLALAACKMVEKRMWSTMSPLRQFPDIPVEIVQKAERVDVPWSAYFELDPPRMGELLNMPRYGKRVCDAVERFPRLNLQVHPRPITKSLMRLELAITPDFTWDDALHGASEGFWILVEDCDGEVLLFHDFFMLRKEYAQSEDSEHRIEVNVPIDEPMPPVYFVSVVSDRWVGSETKVPVVFFNLQMPGKFPPHTPVLDLQPLLVSVLKRQEYMALYEGIGRFNKVQTQVFNSLYTTDENVFVGAPAGVGKTFCAEFSILRHWSSESDGRVVYLAPVQDLVDTQYKNWNSRLSGLAGGKDIVKLTGDLTMDLELLKKGDLILSTPSQWDSISRGWRHRKAVQTVALLIADELHMLGGAGGYTYEVVVSRMRAMAESTESSLRFVGLSVPLSNARDMGEWIGATKNTIYNFSPGVRTIPLELKIQPFNIPHFPSLMLAMAKPTFKAITQLSPNKPAMVFVPNRKQARASATELSTVCRAEDDEDRFLHVSQEEMQPLLDKMTERTLVETLSHGIGYFHEALNSFDKRAVQHLFKIGAIQVLIVSRESCWEIDCNAHLVVVQNTQFFEGREHRYLDYPISDLLQMFGKAGRVGEDKSAKGVLMLPGVKRDYYKKFLNEALPVESHVHESLHDTFVAEIYAKTIGTTPEAVDWVTFTYFYRRLLSNPSYYDLRNTSHEDLSTHLSNIVEQTITDLVDAQLIELDEDEDEITPLITCRIAAYYNLSYITMQTLMMSLNAKSNLKSILEIITAAAEFEDIPIRRHEEHILSRIYDRVPYKMQEVNFESPHFKAYVLLQAYFSRMQLPIDLAKDQEWVVKKVLTLLQASVDVLSSEAHLNATSAVEISQMVVQAMWQNQSPLLQIPHLDDEIVEQLQKFNVKDVADFIETLDPESEQYEKVTKSLQLSNRQLAEVANFCNDHYPELELAYEVVDADNITTNQQVRLKVQITRVKGDEDENENAEDESEEEVPVHAPFYPGAKFAIYYLIVGNERTNTLLSIKKAKVTKAGKKYEAQLEFTLEEPGEHELTLYMMSDSYLDVDQAPTFTVHAAEGMEEDDEDDEDEE